MVLFLFIKTYNPLTSYVILIMAEEMITKSKYKRENISLQFNITEPIYTFILYSKHTLVKYLYHQKRGDSMPIIYSKEFTTERPNQI